MIVKKEIYQILSERSIRDAMIKILEDQPEARAKEIARYLKVNVAVIDGYMSLYKQGKPIPTVYIH